MMTDLQNEKIRIIQHELAGKKGKEARRIATKLARDFGCDITRIYEHSREVRPKRKPRADTGAMRAMNEQTFNALAWHTVNADLSAPHIADIAAGNDLGKVSAATFNRHLRRRGIDRKNNKKDLTPYQSFEAAEPNILHQMDSTVAQQFYLDDDGSIGYEPELLKNKNKPGNKKPRLHLLALIDDHSRCRFARFTLGNHTFAWMTFLYEAWRRKDDATGFPFYGLPTMLYSDNDSVVKSAKFKQAMELLAVKFLAHKVGNPRAKGKVEVSFKILQEFEKITKIKQWRSLDEANADLFDFIYGLNGRKHSVTGQIPFARWLHIRPARLLDVPEAEIFRILHRESLTRILQKNLIVSIDGKPWQLPFRAPFVNFIDKKVQIYRAPDESEKIYIVLDNKEYQVQYLAPGKLGTGGKRAELPKPEALERRESLQAASAPDLQLSGFYEKLYRQEWKTPAGQDFDVIRITGDNRAELVRTKLWFIGVCQEELDFSGPPAFHEMNWINSIFGDKNELPEKHLLGLIHDIKSGAVQISQPQPLALAKVG